MDGVVSICISQQPKQLDPDFDLEFCLLRFAFWEHLKNKRHHICRNMHKKPKFKVSCLFVFGKYALKGAMTVSVTGVPVMLKPIIITCINFHY